MATTQPNVAHHYDRRPTDWPTKGVPKYGWRDENGRPIHWIRKDGTPCCGRKRARQAHYCQQTHLCDNGRCAAPGHNGANGGRPIEHGGRSALLARLGFADKLEAIKNDADHKSHANNIDLYEIAIQTELEQGIPTGEEWEQALALYKTAVAEADSTALRELGVALEQGAAKQKRLERSLQLVDKQRAHKEAEAKREAAIESNLNVREAIRDYRSVGGIIVELLEQEVDDEALRRRLLYQASIRLARHMRRTTPVGN